MRKITVKFNKSKDIENLKKIMRNVYASNSDHLPDIAKFHLGEKIFIPNQVDRAELHIITANGTDIITFSKAALSFYLGTQHPFTKIAMTSEDDGNYIVLPWNLDNRVGRDNLKNLINRIPSNVRELKYIIYVNHQDNLSSLSLENSKDLSQSLTSLASLHLSDIMAEDETENLLNKIGDLEQRLRERDNIVNNLTTQVANLQTQARSVSANQSWTVALPNNLGNLNAPTSSLDFDGIKANLSGWKSYANISDVVGNVTIDLVNKKLIIDGSCNSINAS
ncbi:hypothetical protein [Rickettsia endosymbiont of Oedothorax gibbosus]|uniref:hypothetical protein n=1 Tax=Rickettsia endosymbiont of Oedothorax gibbosus TaxID=931099 RepID=UPI0020247039|nr:hypothetical protein [Rickettsia endosymbiont of Oedothorax gibbosus]